MIKTSELLSKAVESKASDIFIISGIPVSYKLNGKIIPQDDERIFPPAANKLINDLYIMANRSTDILKQTGDDDFSLSVPGLSRFRISAYSQRGSLAAVIRIIFFEIPDYKKLNIPQHIVDTARNTSRGMILVTGPAGSGKTTTLACMIDEINKTRDGHIITLEDPIEFIHKNKKSVISQREIPLDTANFVTALRASMRQAPDVILLGEMRDYETIKTAMTAAETGHLVLSTLHTVGAANTVDRIIDAFPPSQQQQVRLQLSMVLQTVISQQLIQTESGELLPVFEIMHVNNAIRNIIREAKTHQIDAAIAYSASDFMVGMDASLLSLHKEGKISTDTALKYCLNLESMKKRINT